MLKDARNQPKQPEEESDEPPIISAEGRYKAKEDPVGVGEAAGLARMRELNQAEKQRKDIFEGGSYVRQSVASGISAKQSGDAKRLEAAATKARRAEEQREAEAHQEMMHGAGGKARLGGSDKDQAKDDAQKADGELLQKFTHAKTELEKEKKKEESEINKRRNELKLLENEVEREKRLLGMFERSEQVGERQTKQLENDIDELKEEERELKGKAKRDPKTQSELRQVQRKLSDLSFKLRLKERTALTGQARQRTNEQKGGLNKRELAKLGKVIAVHESRLTQIEDLISRERTDKLKKGDSLKEAWRQFNDDLRRLGIRVYH